jgi:biopolymer transport protein ExbB
MVDIIQKGGIVMYPILLCSVVAAVIIVERLIYFWRIRVNEVAMIARLRATLEKGHYDEALSICETNPSPITNLMRMGIEHREDPPNVLRDYIVDAASMEIPKLERFLSALGTVANISTLLGLLGTVTGNINAFGVFGQFGAWSTGEGDLRGPHHDRCGAHHLDPHRHLLQLPRHQGEPHHHPHGEQGE